ncbi:GxxExxY protein [Flavobacterium aurantiibacter]|uniref:GxxExxY protein n=1 Tax=Flavobacterium aurantiibacter TaxID=2023067 RepID=A0A255ZAF6_9FLAO|nr:GxxExxY protein [Flavobacterium aurantiibacter]OYQ38543.1 GxxExxY protein [Flavobacterium aurantiibacter]
MKHEALTHKIIGCAMKVHTILGNGFQEVIYQRALAIEMQKQGLSFNREMEMTIYYEGHDIGTRRVDFFVEDNIMVELKALIKLEDVHLAQAMNYCQAYNLPIGLLINFGAKSLEFKRVYNVNHPENKSDLRLKGLKDDRISSEEKILQSSHPKNLNSDK